MCLLHTTIKGMQDQNKNRLTQVVGNRIRAMRREVGVSQHELSQLAQVDITSLSRIERGITVPKLDMLARLAVALDTSLSYLVKDVTDEHVFPKRTVRLTVTEFIRAREAAEENSDTQP